MGKKTKAERRLTARQKRETIQVLEDSRQEVHPFHLFNPDEIGIIMLYKAAFETFEFQYLKICRSLRNYYVGARGAINVMLDPANANMMVLYNDMVHALLTCFEMADTTFTSILDRDTFNDRDVANEKEIRKLVAVFKRTVPWFERLWTTLLEASPFEGVEVWKARPSDPQIPVPEIPEVFKYMCFRADREGQKMTLDPRYFVERLVLGIREFFGVKTDRVGDIMIDQRNPEAWKEFSRNL